MRQIVQAVSDALLRAGIVQAEISARHAHLCAADIETLFGSGASLVPKRDLSQPGQYLSQQRVTVVGPKGSKEGVAVLGPARGKSQVELSKSDCVVLGIDAPVRLSGDVADSGPCVLEGPCGSVHLREGCIIARSHVHMTPGTARLLGLDDGQLVGVRLLTRRPLVFPEIVVRVSEKFRDRVHLDFDEANAACAEGFTLARILPARGGNGVIDGFGRH